MTIISLRSDSIKQDVGCNGRLNETPPMGFIHGSYVSYNVYSKVCSQLHTTIIIYCKLIEGYNNDLRRLKKSFKILE